MLQQRRIILHGLVQGQRSPGTSGVPERAHTRDHLQLELGE